MSATKEKLLEDMKKTLRQAKEGAARHHSRVVIVEGEDVERWIATVVALIAGEKK